MYLNTYVETNSEREMEFEPQKKPNIYTEREL